MKIAPFDQAAFHQDHPAGTVSFNYLLMDSEPGSLEKLPLDPRSPDARKNKMSATPIKPSYRARAWWCRCEPSISEILAEPIVRAVMEADGVKPEEFAAMLRNAREKVLDRSHGRHMRVHRTPI